MKFRFHILILLLLIYTCDRQLTAPVRDNPFDSASGLTDPFNLQTKNYSDHIQVSWEYTHEKPVVASYLLYRINGSGVDTLYEGDKTTFIDTAVVWDSTYSYYVTGIINEKETSPIDDIPEVVRRIYVGEGSDYTTIGDAMNALKDGDVIYVKDGTYQENIDFKGKKISLICDGESSCIIDGESSGSVVTFSGDEDSTSVLDGFIITGGNNDDDGGAMFIGSSFVIASPLIKNCTFKENQTNNYGGAIMINKRSNPIIRGCNFTANQANGSGGAIFCDRDSKPKIENCTFTGNQTKEGNGGAIAIDEASPTIISCIFESNHASEGSGGAISINESQGDTVRLSTFTSNTAKEGGGAVYTFHVKNSQFVQCKFEGNSGDWGGGVYLVGSGKEVSPILFTNCLFWHNEAEYGGGAILGKKSASLNSYLKFDHCTLTGNKAEEGGASSYGGGIAISINTNLTVSNSILWNNTADDDPVISFHVTSLIPIEYSNVQDGWAGEGNIDADPLFEDSTTGNYHLQDASPCKGAGGGGADMGAYGGENGDWE